MTTQDTTRAEYVAGLRQLADILDTNPDLPLPHEGTEISSLSVFVETRDEVAAWARAIPGKVTKAAVDSAFYGFQLTGRIAGLHMLVHAPRAEVCERVVTGTQTVTIPAQDAMPATPAMPARTETVETVEWVCGSILADTAGASA